MQQPLTPGLCSYQGYKAYVEQVKIRDIDADCNGYFKPSALLRYTEELAISHSAAVGLGHPYYEGLRQACLIGKQALEFSRVPCRNEHITFVTFSEQSHCAANKRITLLLDEAGGEVGIVDSRWIIVDEATNKILRHPDGREEAYRDARVDRGLPQRIRKCADLQDGGLWMARYSQCDVHHHINNTCYLDMASDLLPLELLLQNPVRRAAARYHYEVRLGTAVQLHYGRCEEDGSWYVCGTQEGRVAFEVSLGL